MALEFTVVAERPRMEGSPRGPYAAFINAVLLTAETGGSVVLSLVQTGWAKDRTAGRAYYALQGVVRMFALRQGLEISIHARRQGESATFWASHKAASNAEGHVLNREIPVNGA